MLHACLKWVDIDSVNNTITVNEPGKGSNPRVLKVSSELIARLNSLPRTSEWVFFKSRPKVMRMTFWTQRKRLADKFKNPRLLAIHFHTLRHWKATMEYNKTKDILYVKRMLGHKRIDNTMLYTQLVDFKSEDFTTRVATTLKEDRELIEAGFEYVTERDAHKIYRKRK